ncbi:MAG: tRNA uridine-5-carboxymethylaminomethyl(34) synthesis GTPase MnmE [Bacteroidales bacterium]|jgi:tRNA modification GTPase|nr:tRNA uridine-5-carboxymethylaminomethyl(34) synthesis GTPase MnmE [Bacteroidales bacterium]
MNRNDTICAISTASGIGAIAIVRLSGSEAFSIADHFLQGNFNLLALPPNMVKFASFVNYNQLIDNVVVSKFIAPHSYTGEDLLEISCHGSEYIQKKILELLIDQGARLANPGEFTMRAFLYGKLDLPQAEAVGDLINAQSESSHSLAVKQLKGTVSKSLKELHRQFLDMASLLELELDFSEEEVEFADRKQITDLLNTLKNEVTSLLNSFQLGNALKQGIPVAIIGKPNAGKSTLLNALIQEDRAIVSAIPGTTRDTIEDVFNIDGITFRMIDTAGLRQSNNEIEALGIDRTYQVIKKATIAIYLFDITNSTLEDALGACKLLENQIDFSNKKLIIVGNKIDEIAHFNPIDEPQSEIYYISAKQNIHLENVTDSLVKYVNSQKITDSPIITDSRHYDILSKILISIKEIEKGFAIQLPTDLITIEVRNALQYLGLATGKITTDDILNNIFGKFCIGK